MLVNILNILLLGVVLGTSLMYAVAGGRYIYRHNHKSASKEISFFISLIAMVIPTALFTVLIDNAWQGYPLLVSLTVGSVIALIVWNVLMIAYALIRKQ